MASPFRVENGVVTYNGKPTTELTEEERRQLYGSAGDILNDPKYRERVQVGQGDAGFVEEERVSQEAEQRLLRNGQWYRQVGALRSVGGEGEVSDPSKIEWDEELGWITPMSNVKEYDDTVFTPGMLLLAGGMMAAIAATGGLAGLGISGAGEGAAAAESLGGATTGGGGIVGAETGLGQYAGMTTGLDGAALTGATETTAALGAAPTPAAGLGAAPAAAPTAGIGGGLGGGGGSIFPAGAGIAGPTLETAGLVTQVPATTQAMANASALLSNLTPTSQRIITSAIGQGVSAISASRRQQEAQTFAREQSDINYQRRLEEEERAREERRVRGTPQAYTFNVTPRAGIIGGGMGG